MCTSASVTLWRLPEGGGIGGLAGRFVSCRAFELRLLFFIGALLSPVPAEPVIVNPAEVYTVQRVSGASVDDTKPVRVVDKKIRLPGGGTRSSEPGRFERIV